MSKDLVATGAAIEEMEYIVNKRISLTPISIIGSSACKSAEDFIKYSSDYR